MALADRFRFSVFEVDLHTRELRKHGVRIKLQDLPFRLLVSLAARPGELVTRAELQSALWPDGAYVDFERGLGTAMNKLREALGDSAVTPRFIETVPRRGYRFLVNVEGLEVAQRQAEISSDSRSPQAAGSPSHDARWLFGSWAVVLAGTLALVIGVLALGWARREKAPARTALPVPIRALAVLPLRNLSGDPRQDYFADGITEELTTELGKVRALRVISRSSATHFKNTGTSIREIARELHVNAVIEGAVLRSGNQVTVTARLLRVPADEQLWAKTYEGDLNDINVFEDEVARDIAKEIRIELSALENSRLAHARPVSSEVHDAYLLGRDQWNQRTPTSLRRALECFQAAIQRDPEYAPAYAGLADTYAILGAAGYDAMPESEAMERARAAALKAVSLDDSLADAHTSLAFVAYSYDWNWEQAEREFQRALDLSPSGATAHQWYSEYLADVGRWKEAILEAEHAAAVDPMSSIIRENLGRPYYYSRHWERAIENSRKTLQLDPDFPISHLRLGRAYAAAGRYPEAAAEFQRYFERSGGNTLALASLANVRARSGQRKEALQLIAQLHSLSSEKYVPAYQFALIYAGMNEADEAMRWLEKAYQERSDFLVCLKVEPLFDSLRADRRFQDLERRIGLEP